LSLVLFGPPGAGKGTQSSLMIEKLGMSHISTGDLFRAAMKNETPLGVEAKGYVDSGKLVPDSVTIGLVREVIQADPKGQYIFDGFPRNEAQAEALEAMLTENGAQKIDMALFLEVPEDVLIKRLAGRRLCKDCGAVYHVDGKPPQKDGECDKCGGEVYQRKDDHEDVIGTRLKAYEDGTAPLKSYYSDRKMFVSVDGLGSADAVFERIQKHL